MTIYNFRFRFALQADGQEVASVVSAQEIRVVAELLQISPEALQKAITYKVTVSISVGNCFLITFYILLKATSLKARAGPGIKPTASFSDWVVLFSTFTVEFDPMLTGR